MQNEYTYNAKRIHLQCKRGYIRMAKVVLLLQKGAFLSLRILLILLPADVTVCV